MITCKRWQDCPENRRLCCAECVRVNECSVKCTHIYEEPPEQCRLAEVAPKGGEPDVLHR